MIRWSPRKSNTTILYVPSQEKKTLREQLIHLSTNRRNEDSKPNPQWEIFFQVKNRMPLSLPSVLKCTRKSGRQTSKTHFLEKNDQTLRSSSTKQNISTIKALHVKVAPKPRKAPNTSTGTNSTHRKRFLSLTATVWILKN